MLHLYILLGLLLNAGSAEPKLEFKLEVLAFEFRVIEKLVM